MGVQTWSVQTWSHPDLVVVKMGVQTWSCPDLVVVSDLVLPDLVAAQTGSPRFPRAAPAHNCAYCTQPATLTHPLFCMRTHLCASAFLCCCSS